MQHRFGLLAVVFVLSCAAAGEACDYCNLTGVPVCPHAANRPASGDGSPTFVRQGGQWPQPGGDGSPVTITYSYNNLLDGGLKDPSGRSLPARWIRASVEEALSVWASAAPLHFVEVRDEGGGPFRSAYPDGQFGQIRLNHVPINGPDPPVGPPTTKAQAFFPSAGGNLGGDVFYDIGDPWSRSGTTRSPDILGATIHELGHALGLGHDSNPDSNMFWIFTRYPGLGTGALHASDRAGIQSIYGAGVGSVTPLAFVPEPGSLVLASLLGGLVLTRRAQRTRR